MWSVVKRLYRFRNSRHGLRFRVTTVTQIQVKHEVAAGKLFVLACDALRVLTLASAAQDAAKSPVQPAHLVLQCLCGSAPAVVFELQQLGFKMYVFK